MSEYQLTLEDDDSWTLTLSDQGVSIAAAHASTHAAAGDDPLTLANTQITGLGTMSTQDSDAVAITGGTLDGVTITTVTLTSPTISTPAIAGGTISGITDLSLADGGTGASSAPAARTNLGIGSLGTQNANGVAITGGTITGITDIVVADGGTGASTLTGILQGNGTSAFTANTSSTAGQVLRCTGANTYAFGAVDLADTDAVTGALPVANGGTGATTVAGALTALGIVAGTGTLSGGTVTIADANVTATSSVLITPTETSANSGYLDVIKTAGVGFEVESSNASDDRAFDYLIIY